MRVSAAKQSHRSTCSPAPQNTSTRREVPVQPFTGTTSTRTLAAMAPPPPPRRPPAEWPLRAREREHAPPCAAGASPGEVQAEGFREEGCQGGAGGQPEPPTRASLGACGVGARAVPESYRDLSQVLGDLGAFYRANGPRASLPPDKLEDLLRQLDAARAQLAREDQEASGPAAR